MSVMKSYSRFNVPFDLEVDFELSLYEYISNLKPEAARRVLVQGAAFKTVSYTHLRAHET